MLNEDKKEIACMYVYDDIFCCIIFNSIPFIL